MTPFRDPDFEISPEEIPGEHQAAFQSPEVADDPWHQNGPGGADGLAGDLDPDDDGDPWGAVEHDDVADPWGAVEPEPWPELDEPAWDPLPLPAFEQTNEEFWGEPEPTRPAAPAITSGAPRSADVALAAADRLRAHPVLALAALAFTVAAVMMLAGRPSGSAPVADLAVAPATQGIAVSAPSVPVADEAPEVEPRPAPPRRPRPRKQRHDGRDGATAKFSSVGKPGAWAGRDSKPQPQPKSQPAPEPEPAPEYEPEPEYTPEPEYEAAPEYEPAPEPSPAPAPIPSDEFGIEP